MNKYLYIGLSIIGLFFIASSVYSASVTPTFFGGTGTSSPSGILYGDNNATDHLNTVIIDGGLTFSGGILSAIGSTFPFTPTTNFGAAANATSTPIWFQAGLQSSSTAQLTDINTIGLLSFATTSAVATSTLISYNGQNFLTASSTAFNTGLGLSALANVISATSSTAFGYQALMNATSSYSNTAIGYQALLGSDTISNIGFNTAVGYKALSAITFGSSNTALGFSAGTAQTSGVNNSFVGAFSGIKATTGNSNTFVGFNSGAVITTASANTLIGANAGQNISIGSSNTIVGSAAGISFTNGTNNALFGQSAGRFISGASASTTALGTNTAGGFISSTPFLTIGSTYVGAAAGPQVTASSDYNAFFGAMTGAQNTSGYDNTFLGSYAGQNNTTGANNITLGWNALLPSATNNNQLSIGNLIFGTNLPATTSATTLTLPTTGLLGVGTTSPFAKFSIQTNNGDTTKVLFAIGSSTASATSTLFSISNIGSTTIGNFGTCSGTNALTTNSSGTISCGAVTSTGGASFPFTPTTNFGATANSTSTPIWFQQGLQASSTANLVDTNIYGRLGFVSTSSNVLATFNGQTFLSATTTTSGLFALGYQAGSALLATTTTAGNTAFGYQALNIATSSSWNTAIGYQALKNTIDATNGSGSNATNSGSNNTALGYQALTANTKGDSNNAMGSFALTVNTTGRNNNAQGQSALTRNTTGSSNVAIGSDAYYGSTGNQNVAIGGSAMSGNFSTFVGSSDNVAIGWHAGYSVQGGAFRNLFLGSDAGDSITTGDGNIVLGAYVDVPSATGNGQLNIGNVLYGTGLYNASTLSAVPVLGGKLGIGTSTPFATFSIQANNGDTTKVLFAIGSSTQTATTTLFLIDNVGHEYATTTPPVISSCGTGPSMVGSDDHGTVTTGATAGGCTITFGNAWKKAPTCTISEQTGSVVNAFSYTVSATEIVVTQTALGGGIVDYICRGNP